MVRKEAWFVIRLIYGVQLFLAIYMLVGFVIDRQFVTSDLHRWRDADSTVTQSAVTNESMATNTKKEYGKKVFYNSYTVSYTYTAEFNAWGKMFRYEYSGSNSGKTDSSAKQIPESAYEFPKQGDTVKVIYDPDEEDSYRLGLIEDWQNRADFSLGNLLPPAILLAVAAVMIIVDIVINKKKRVHHEPGR